MRSADPLSPASRHARTADTADVTTANVATATVRTADTPTADASSGVAQANAKRFAWLLVTLGGLVVATAASLLVGSTSIPWGTVVEAFVAFDGSNDHLVVHDMRLPRTLLGLCAGASLGLAGALMQALTRNPLAEPGILGVNAGAAFLVVVSASLFGLSNPLSYIWFAFFGAAVTAVAVYLLGTMGRGGATPVRLALAGVAISAVLGGLTTGLTLLNSEVFNQFRYWSVGSLAGRQMDIVAQTVPFMAVGAVLALALSRSLNTVALGEDAARALGANLNRTRVVGVLAITLLCGGATAAVGPIAFVGLVVPHFARKACGPDQRWILPYSLMFAAMLLLIADVLGRVLARPAELQVGIVTAFVGAPVLIALVRRTNLSKL